MNCKGIPVPLDNFLLMSVLSSLYAPITVFGSLLMILTIIIDPLKELKTFSNLIYINVLVSDFCFGAFVDPYRAWGNKIKSDGINLRKVYPYAVHFGKTCHIFYLAGQLIALFALTAMSADLMIHKSVGKVSYLVTAVTSICIWGFGIGFALFYVAYKFSEVELVINSVTLCGCLISFAANYFILYRPAKKSLMQIHAQIPISLDDHRAPANNEKYESTIEMEPNIPRKDENEKVEKVEADRGVVAQFGDDKEDLTANQSVVSAEQKHQRLRSIEALLLYYGLLIVFTGSSCAIIYADLYDEIHLSCYSGHMLKAWRLMFIVTHKVFNPILCLLIVPALRRSCLQLLRLRNYRQVAPMA